MTPVLQGNAGALNDDAAAEAHIITLNIGHHVAFLIRRA